MAKAGPKGNAWVREVIAAGQKRRGKIVRRSIRSVARYASPDMLETAVRAHRYHMALLGTQYVILCTTKGPIQVIC